MGHEKAKGYNGQDSASRAVIFNQRTEMPEETAPQNFTFSVQLRALSVITLN